MYRGSLKSFLKKAKLVAAYFHSKTLYFIRKVRGVRKALGLFCSACFSLGFIFPSLLVFCTWFPITFKWFLSFSAWSFLIVAYYSFLATRYSLHVVRHVRYIAHVLPYTFYLPDGWLLLFVCFIHYLL